MQRFYSLSLFALFACLYLLTSAGDFYSSDGEVMYQTAGALVDRAALSLPPNPGLPQIVRAANGEYVSKYEPGMSLAMLPFYQLGSLVAAWTGEDRVTWTRLMVSFMPALCMALAVTVVYCIAARLTSRRWALAVALIAGVATPVWPYSRVLFPESLLAALLALALWAGIHRGLWPALLAGLFLGAAIATRAVNVLYMGPLAALVGLSDPGRALKCRVTWVLLGALPGVMLVLLHNLYRFGSPFIFGYTGENFVTNPLIGAYGLLLSSGKGVFWYAPPLIVAGVAWPRLWKIHRPLVLTLLLMGLIAAPVYGAWQVWHGGWAWGPRYLVPLVPLWMLPLAALPRRRVWEIALVMALIAGVMIQWMAVRANSNDHYAAMDVDRDTGAMTRVLFEPTASPILAQWQLYTVGRTVPLAVARLPMWGGGIAAGLLLAGLVGAAWQLAQRMVLPA